MNRCSNQMQKGRAKPGSCLTVLTPDLTDLGNRGIPDIFKLYIKPKCQRVK